jgi:hypothetical protein
MDVVVMVLIGLALLSVIALAFYGTVRFVMATCEMIGDAVAWCSEQALRWPPNRLRTWTVRARRRDAWPVEAVKISRFDFELHELMFESALRLGVPHWTELCEPPAHWMAQAMGERDDARRHHLAGMPR